MKKNIIFSVVLIILLVVIALLGFLYYTEHQKVIKLNNQISTIKSEDKMDTETEEEYDDKQLIEFATYLLEDKYETAKQIYYGIHIFDYVDSKEKIEINGMLSNKITNYEDIINESFTEKARIEFEKGDKTLVAIVDGVAYMQQGGYGITTYAGVEFKNIEVSEDKITATAVTKHAEFENGPDNIVGYSTREDLFSIVKVDGKWLVDEYTDVKIDY